MGNFRNLIAQKLFAALSHTKQAGFHHLAKVEAEVFHLFGVNSDLDFRHFVLVATARDCFAIRLAAASHCHSKDFRGFFNQRVGSSE